MPCDMASRLNLSKAIVRVPSMSSSCSSFLSLIFKFLYLFILDSSFCVRLPTALVEIGL